MSTGLMSCVRQHSPPLELNMSSDGTPTSRTTTSSSTPTNQRPEDVQSLNTTQKRRRRFHPLRNLRRIFRIGSTDDTTSHNSSAYRPASELDQSDDYTQSSGGGGGARLSPPDTPIRVVPSTTNIQTSADYHNTSSCDSLLYSPPNGHRAPRRRHPSTGQFDDHQHSRGQPKPVLHLRKSRESLYRESTDSTDFQRRSISECLGDDLKHESLSQSHDSVFSESVTASSMSLGLKAELTNVLRKKYYDRGSSSERRVEADNEDEEDLGFPRSPNTPIRGASVSAVSPLKHMQKMSSDGSLSMMSMGSSELNTAHSPSTKYRLTKSKTESDEDIAIRPKPPLNHSAARHRMAVRPPKKAPSRMTRIQTVQEVSGESTALLDETDALQTSRTKSSSLPPGVDAKKSMHHTAITMSAISIVNSNSSTQQMYSNRYISKSTDFEVTASEIDTAKSDGNDKDVNGFFRRLLSRSSTKKKRAPDALPSSNSLNTIVQLPEAVAAQQIKPKPLVKPDKPKSGPASRQRVIPREIQSSPLKIAKPPLVLNKSPDNLPANQNNVSAKTLTDPLSPKPFAAPRTFELRPSRSSSSSKFAFASGAVARVTSEYEIKRQDEPKSPTSHHRSDEQLYPRFLKHSPFADSPNMRIIQSSQSIDQVAASTTSIDDTPSANSTPTRKPVEKSKSFRFYTETSADSSLHCSVGHMPSLPDLSFTSESSSTTTATTDSPNHRDLINKFEINDNNLVVSAAKTAKVELTGSRKSVFVTTTCETSGADSAGGKSPSKEPSSALKLPTESKIHPSNSNSNINQIEDNIDRIMKFACVTVLKTPAALGHLARDEQPAGRHPFGRAMSIEDEPKERRFSNESVEIAEKLNVDTDNGVIVERRKSVTDEKLKFERKIQERFRNCVSVPEPDAESRKSSLSDGDAIAAAAGPAVVMRRKSVLYGARPVTSAGSVSAPASDDQTPELMKVFARRSLKLKDQDDYVVCTDEPNGGAKSACTPTEVGARSSVESSTQITTTTSVGRSPTKTASLGSTVTPIVSSTGITPIVSRLSGGYHGPMTHSTTITNPMPGVKSVSSGLLKTGSLITQLRPNNNNDVILQHTNTINNINHNNNNNNDIAIIKSVAKHAAADNDANQNHQKATTIRSADEFKGILQRRAEWEKRATQNLN